MLGIVMFYYRKTKVLTKHPLYFKCFETKSDCTVVLCVRVDSKM